MIFGYAIVSTTEQNLDLHRDALKRAGCEKIIADTVSGSAVQSPGLEHVHDALRSGDVLAVLAAATPCSILLFNPDQIIVRLAIDELVQRIDAGLGGGCD